MTSWLTENSTVPMIAGAILTLIFIAFWVHSREKAMLKVAIGVAVITAAIVTCEQMVVTQREEVTDQIYALANSVQRNDFDATMEFFSVDHAETRRRAEAEMPRYDFQNCRVSAIFKFNLLKANPPTAEVLFNASVTVRVDNGAEPLWGQRRIKLTLEKNKEGVWKIIAYSHSDPRSGITL